MPSEKEQLITAEELRAALSYDPETGVFTWKERPEMAKEWNTRYAGKRAGSVKVSTATLSYRIIMFNKKKYREHHLAWFLMTGLWPSPYIDHKDGDGLNNKFSNLRLATLSQNQANKKMACNNKVGLKGVIRNGNGFQARICFNGKTHHVGYFATAEEAHAAYMKTAKKQFGEFARAE